jgi:hypothetical protein
VTTSRRSSRPAAGSPSQGGGQGKNVLSPGGHSARRDVAPVRSPAVRSSSTRGVAPWRLLVVAAVTVAGSGTATLAEAEPRPRPGHHVNVPKPIPAAGDVAPFVVSASSTAASAPTVAVIGDSVARDYAYYLARVIGAVRPRGGRGARRLSRGSVAARRHLQRRREHAPARRRVSVTGAHQADRAGPRLLAAHCHLALDERDLGPADAPGQGARGCSAVATVDARGLG